MSLADNPVTFRRAYFKTEDIDISILDALRLSPNAPLVHVEKFDLLTSQDIVRVKLTKKIGNENEFRLKIVFKKRALRILNYLCEEDKFPCLVAFIRGVPFYEVFLRGPFDKPILEWTFFCDEGEADMLGLNLQNLADELIGRERSQIPDL